MITAIFENNQLMSYSLKTWQYDYGQILRIEGLNLPTAVEIHFALTEKGGESVTRIGMTKDGVTDVVIPDSFLENNDVTQDYRIYAFIYLRDDTSGQTEYKIPISVTSRPKPEAFDRPEDGEIFKEAIQAVRESADQAAESARQAETAKESAETAAESARQSSTAVETARQEVAKKTKLRLSKRLVDLMKKLRNQAQRLKVPRQKQLRRWKIKAMRYCKVFRRILRRRWQIRLTNNRVSRTKARR